MEHRRLGASGLQVPVLSFGAGTFGGRGDLFGAWGRTDVAEARELVDLCLEHGVNLFDTADVYSGGASEEILGAAIRGRRDRVLISTKAGLPMGDGPAEAGTSRIRLINSVEAALRRLGTDRIDLYQLHRLDPRVDLEESLGALDDLVRAGKVISTGTSGVSAHDLVTCQWTATEAGFVRPVSEQSPYSVFVRAAERTLFPACLRHGVGVLVYGPLNGGWLTGKYRAGQPPPEGSRAAQRFYDGGWWDRERPEVQRKLALVDQLDDLARDCGLRLADLALAFTLAHPAVTCALVGPRTPEQLESALAAADVRLDADVLDRIDELVEPGYDIDPTDLVVVDDALDVVNRRRPLARAVD